MQDELIDLQLFVDCWGAFKVIGVVFDLIKGTDFNPRWQPAAVSGSFH